MKHTSAGVQHSTAQHSTAAYMTCPALVAISTHPRACVCCHAVPESPNVSNRTMLGFWAMACDGMGMSRCACACACGVWRVSNGDHVWAIKRTAHTKQHIMEHTPPIDWQKMMTRRVITPTELSTPVTHHRSLLQAVKSLPHIHTIPPMS